MSVDADPAKAYIDAAKARNDFMNLFRCLRIREDSLLLRHDQLRINLFINRAFHEAAEGQRAVFTDIRFIVIEILIHVDEPAVFQRHPVAVDQPDENRILPDRSDRTDKDCVSAGLIVFLDRFLHFERELIKHLAGIRKL